MQFRQMLLRLLIVLSLLGSLHAADILDEPVPWEGKISKSTLAELIARMRGWSDTGKSGSFELSTEIPKELLAKELKRFSIPDKPRPTYREIFVSALEQTGQKAVVRRGEKGIEIIYRYSRVIPLYPRTQQALARRNRWHLDGIKSELKDKGVVLSEFVTMRFEPQKSILILTGIEEDLDKTATFFGH